MVQITEIIGSGSGKSGSSSRVASEDQNTLQSTSLARVLDVISAGPIVGLVCDANGIYFDDTALQNSDGTYNFCRTDDDGNSLPYEAGIDWAQRLGLPDQDYMAGFTDTATTVSVSVEVKVSTPLVRTVSGPIDAARITVTIPALTYQNASTGDLHGSSVKIRFQRRETGTETWETVSDITITGKCVSTYQFSKRITLGGDGDWDLRLVRLTADSTQSNLQNHTWWASTSLITDGKFIYPNTAYIGLTADARYFGSSIPSRAYKCKLRIIKVPSNYDPDARAYTGLWDGTFKSAWTNNPAWVLYDVLTDQIDCLGRYIDEDQVDKWTLYEIAQYCDELVDDGFGGKEPRFTFNYQITSMEDAYKVVQSIASVFRGLTYWASGQIFFFADMPSDPARPVTAANVKDGLFTYEGAAYSAQHSAVYVTWFDPDDMCRQAIELVEDPELITKFGWRTTEITAYACTSRGQAHRLGKWLLDTEKYSTETVNYEASLDHINFRPGDIIEIYDPDYQGLRLGGRIVEASANSVTIDDPIIIEKGKTYTLKIVMPDCSMAKRILTNSVGNTTVLSFDDALTTMPVDQAIWGVTVSDLAPRQFRVLSIKESGENNYIVSALFHDPTKYERVEQDIQLDTLTYTSYKTQKPDAPTALTIKEYVYRYNAALRSAATLTWTPPAYSKIIEAYEVQRRRADGNWESCGTTALTSMDIKDCESGDWVFRICAIGFNGLVSYWFVKTVTLFGVAAAPSDVMNFNLQVLGSIGTLSWDNVSDLDLSHYRIKHSTLTSGATWGSAIDLVVKATGVSIQVPVMDGTYLIKAVDLSGSESKNATLVVTTVSGVTGLNAVAALSDWPSWSGTHDGTAADGSILKLASGSSYGIYTFAQTYDLGAVYTSRLSAVIDAYGVTIGRTWASLGRWSLVGTWSQADPSAWAVKVQMRLTQDDPNNDPTWSAWTDLIVGDYTARAYQFRLILSSTVSNVTPAVADVTATVDMPDRVESDVGLVVPAVGLAVVFNPAFREAPAIGPTCQNGQTGDTHQYLSGPTNEGYTIQFLDNTGTPVQRTMDAIYRGIGYAA